MNAPAKNQTEQAAEAQSAAVKTKDLPLSVRKEVLRTRALLERIECARAAQQIQADVHSNGLLGTVATTVVGRKHLGKLDVAKQGWAGMLDTLGIAKDYPVLSTAASFALSTLGSQKGGWVARIAKVGLVAGVGYMGYQKIQESRKQRRAEAAAETALQEEMVGYEGAVMHWGEE